MDSEDSRLYSQAAKIASEVDALAPELRPAEQQKWLEALSSRNDIRALLIYMWQGSDRDHDKVWKPGDELGGYILVKPCGRGGFGDVWLAKKCHDGVETPFALKLLRPRTMTPEAIRAEMMIQNRVRGHIHVQSVSEVFVFNGQPVIVMEHVPGGSLASLLQTEGRGGLPVDRALGYAEDLLDALVHVHGKGIVHGDVKPANLLVQGGDALKLTDFGLARADTDVAPDGIGGTRAFMSPEALSQQGQPTFHLDLWAFGVVFYVMLTGELPYAEMAHPYAPPLPLPDRIDERVQRIVMKCLAENPLDRYPSAKALFKVVEAIRHRLHPRSPSDMAPPYVPPLPTRIARGAMVLAAGSAVMVGVWVAVQHVPLVRSAYAIPREPTIEPGDWDGHLRKTVVSNLNTAVANCQARWVGRGSGIDGDLTVSFNVQPDGSVANALAITEDPMGADVQHCAETYARRLHFARPPSEATVVSVRYALMRPAVAPRPPAR